MSRSGRPTKPYHSSDGQIIPGLARSRGGRWRIVATGERFRESDEAAAIQRFGDWEAKHPNSPDFAHFRLLLTSLVTSLLRRLSRS